MANLIFDFDGTLADTLPQARILFDNLKLRAPLTDDEIARWRGMTIINVLREVKIPIWKVPSLISTGRRDMKEIIKHVEMFDGIDAMLRDLKQRGHRLYVVSSNSVDNINDFMDRYQATDLFDHIYGDASFFAKYKNIRSVMQVNGLEQNQSVYIGDETRDIEAARKVGIPCVSVTWGFNAKSILLEHKPNFIVDTPAELQRLLASDTEINQ